MFRLFLIILLGPKRSTKERKSGSVRSGFYAPFLNFLFSSPVFLAPPPPSLSSHDIDDLFSVITMPGLRLIADTCLAFDLDLCALLPSETFSVEWISQYLCGFELFPPSRFLSGLLAFSLLFVQNTPSPFLRSVLYLLLVVRRCCVCD
jgi:hypothetical protein